MGEPLGRHTRDEQDHAAYDAVCRHFYRFRTGTKSYMTPTGFSGLRVSLESLNKHNLALVAFRGRRKSPVGRCQRKHFRYGHRKMYRIQRVQWDSE